MGETRDQAICAARPEDCVGLYLRRDLSGQRKRRRARPTLLQQRGHALHLEEISLAVATGAHALVLLDQAGWHVSKELPVPGNMTLVPLLPESPELTQSKISGSSCATTGSRTGFSNPTSTSSITVASPGTGSSICPGKLCPSEQENGPIGRNQRDLVLLQAKTTNHITRRQQRSSYRCSNRRRIEQTCAAWVGQGSRGHCHVRPRRARPLALRIYWRTHLSKSHQAFRTSALQTWREVVAA
jgi:hypothetical protein